MKNIWQFLLFSLLFVWGCNTSETPDTSDDTTDTLEVVNNSSPAVEGFAVPSFEISMELSEKAAKKLKDNKESIIATAYLFGEAKDKSLQEKDQYDLSSHDVELTDGATTAKFEGIVVPKEKYEQLVDKDFIINVNVYSGRRSTDVNLLSCGIVQDKVSKVGGGKHIVKCSLIEE